MRRRTFGKDCDIVRSWPNMINFRTYSKDEILSLSVKEITECELVYEDREAGDKTAQLDGLYDTAMGPMNRGERCTTCNSREMHCPGHCGHINLPSPAINPVFFTTLKMLLSASCPDCSHFLCTEKALLTLQSKLLCLNAGRMDIFTQIDVETKEHYGAEKDTEGGTDGNFAYGTRSKTLEELRSFLAEKTSDLKMTNKDHNRSTVFHKREVMNTFIDYFKKKIKKCPRCLAAVPSTKFESAGGVTRVFLELPRRKTIDVNASDSDDDIEKQKNENAKSDITLQRLPTKLLFRQIKRLFQIEKDTCELLFDGAGHESFFIETVLVPPNCFRRMNKAGRKVLASDRTAQLQKVLETAKKLTWLYGHRAGEHNGGVDEGYESTGDKIKVQSFLSTIPGNTLDEKQEHLEITMQQFINILIDSNMERAITTKAPGIKQRLEKKQGLFRQNIMGKRVNFCARTVITPDPCISTNEFGVSDFVAKKLTYPERVTQYNYKELQRAVINGPKKHPGAVAIIWPNGTREMLDPEDENQRVASANQLLTTEDDAQGLARMKTVLRHLRSGDAIIGNRQPTLHKGSIMAFRARVIPGEKTFRLHYSNCKHFNADFDGDEMNVHFPQSEEARVEAETLMNADHMFRSAKDGYPLAGLMQDHVIGGTMMCVRGSFFDKSEYQNLVINCLERHCAGKRIKFMAPAIFKPKTLWTGKQVITTIIHNICNGTGPNYVGPCKMKDNEYIPAGVKEGSIPNPNSAKGCSMTETEFVVRHGYVCSGYLDKNQVGAAKYSILAAIEEIFGGATVGKIITAITCCLSQYLKCYRGFTLGIRDVVTHTRIAKKRKKIVKTADVAGLKELAAHFELASELPQDPEELLKLDRAVRSRIRHAHLIGSEFTMHEIDAVCKKASNSVTEQIHKICEPNLEEKFPVNNLETLIVTGAKGSKANLLNMASNLGQVEFDGKRPKIMASGRCFPCWKPYEHEIRAGAFISHRYAGGLRPQEMFFHVMAGRDGLIDTACKTSSSGYLQRCLIKHLEGITISYDRTVRDHDGSVVQFQYGEDGIDVAQTPYIMPHQFDFIKENSAFYRARLWPQGKTPKVSDEVNRIQKQKEKFKNREVKNGWKERNVGGINRVLAFNDFLKAHEKLSEFNKMLPEMIIDQGRQVIDSFNHMAVKSWHQVTTKKRKSGKVRKNLDPDVDDLEEVFVDEVPLTEEIRQMWISKRHMPDPHLAILSPDVHLGCASEAFISQVKTYLSKYKNSSIPIKELLYAKYQRSLMAPGDQIGLVIAQSVGEPSTQMTLNTFHMAGKADVNITLGIPRLRELLMTAPTEVKTPSMTIPFHSHITRPQVEDFVNTLKRVRLSDVITTVKGQNKLVINGDKLFLQTEVEIHIGRKLCKNFGLNPEHVVADIIRLRLFQVVIKKLEDAEKARNKQEVYVQQNIERARRGKAPGRADTAEKNDEPAIIPDEGSDKEVDVDECEYEDVDDIKEEDDREEIVTGGADEEMNDNEAMSLLAKLNMTNQSDSFWEKVLASHQSVSSVVHDVKKWSWILVTFNRKPSSENIDLVQIIEAAVKEIQVQGIPKIGKVTWKESEDKKNFELLTEGINFPGFYKYPKMFDLRRISTNDINAFRNQYGIEAAVMTMQREIDKVFKPYGIEIDKRHTSMIADYVTQEGQYRAFNRHGLKTCASPIQKMTYETTTQFLIDSIVYGEEDDMSSPAASVLAGQLFKGGTGYFDIRQQILF